MCPVETEVEVQSEESEDTPPCHEPVPPEPFSEPAKHALEGDRATSHTVISKKKLTKLIIESCDSKHVTCCSSYITTYVVIM